MKLVIRTQFMENYGAHDWDGEGECPQYWKMKGGSEYMIENVPLNIDYAAVVEMAEVEKNNEYVREYILDWSLESDDYMSWFEKSQLEYDGKISCKEPRIDYDEINSRYTDPMEYANMCADNDAVAYGG
jgi:hypothetical protein